MLPEVALYFDRIQGRLDMIKDCLEEISSDEEQLNWRPEPHCPSIFSLAAYVAMNTDYWIGHALGHLPVPPGLDNVLEQAHGPDRFPLLQRLDSARDTTRRVLEKMDGKTLDRSFIFNDEPVSSRQCILQALEDAAERYGEISTLMEWWGSE